MTEQMTEQQSKQQTFDHATLAYVGQATMDNVHIEKNALRLDAANNEDPLFAHQPDKRFEFAVLNWNDTCTDTERYKYCGEISDTLRQLTDTRSPRDIPHDLLSRWHPYKL